MTWNYRLVRHTEWGTPFVAIHEVYYDDDGVPIMATQKPVDLLGDDAEEIKGDLEYIVQAFDRPILDWEDIVDET